MNRQALFFTVFPPLAFLIVIYKMRHFPWTPLRIAGIIVMLAGMAFLTLARIQLSNSFSWGPQARTLVTTGLYSRIRNPVYVFGGVAVVGLILYMNHLWWLVLLGFILVVQWVRARAEARVLEEKFGDDYRRWRAQTWF